MSDVQNADVGGRKFGYWTGHFVVVASMIGAGILTTSGFTLNATGNPTGMLALWVIGGVLALCGAVTVAELATAMPRSGGDYVFVREAYGHGAAIVSGWATYVIGFAAPTAVVSHLAVAYLTSPFITQLAESSGRSADEVRNLVVPLGASLFVIGVAVIHILGARQSSWFQVTATIVKATILVGIALGGILFGKGDWNHLNAGYVPTETKQWAPLAIGLIYVMYTYSGWNGAIYLAGEIKNPSRLLPLCLIGGTATVIALYLLVNVAYVYALDPVAMTSAKFEDFSQVARIAVDAMFGRDAANVVAVALGLSLVASFSAYTLVGPRVAYAMAKDGAFPGYAARLHPTRQTPIWATLTQVTIAIGLIWSGTFEELLNYTSVGLAVVTGLTVAAIFPIRRRQDLPHPYKMPLYPLPPILFLLLLVWTVGFTLYEELFVGSPMRKPGPGPVTYSLLTLLVGIPLAYLIPAKKTGNGG
ncbi:MAG TPA: amino acid permease [Fimbriiglobus sp.]|nr:amino acid permease [Fimbriiglobus sp.]